MPSKPGFTWDVAGPPNPDNGHCVVGVGYSNKGVKICTWGMLGTLTDEAVEKYATTTGSGELYTVISQDAINKATQKAPAGFDWSQLIADFNSMGGNLAPPTTLQATKSITRSTLPASSLGAAIRIRISIHRGFGEVYMRTDKYADADLQRRSDLATSLKYGAKAPAPPTVKGSYAENIRFPPGSRPCRPQSLRRRRPTVRSRSST